MTIPNQGHALSAGDMIMRTESGGLLITTTGAKHQRTIHLTTIKKGQANQTVSLTQKQARQITQHINNQL